MTDQIGRLGLMCFGFLVPNPMHVMEWSTGLGAVQSIISIYLFIYSTCAALMLLLDHCFPHNGMERYVQVSLTFVIISMSLGML